MRVFLFKNMNMDITEVQNKAKVLKDEISVALLKFIDDTATIPEVSFVITIQNSNCGQLKKVDVKVKIDI